MAKISVASEECFHRSTDFSALSNESVQLMIQMIEIRRKIQRIGQQERSIHDMNDSKIESIVSSQLSSLEHEYQTIEQRYERIQTNLFSGYYDETIEEGKPLDEARDARLRARLLEFLSNSSIAHCTSELESIPKLVLDSIYYLGLTVDSFLTEKSAMMSQILTSPVFQSNDPLLIEMPHDRIEALAGVIPSILEQINSYLGSASFWDKVPPRYKKFSCLTSFQLNEINNEPSSLIYIFPEMFMPIFRNNGDFRTWESDILFPTNPSVTFHTPWSLSALVIKIVPELNLESKITILNLMDDLLRGSLDAFLANRFPFLPFASFITDSSTLVQYCANYLVSDVSVPYSCLKSPDHIQMATSMRTESLLTLASNPIILAISSQILNYIIQVSTALESHIRISEEFMSRFGYLGLEPIIPLCAHSNHFVWDPEESVASDHFLGESSQYFIFWMDKEEHKVLRLEAVLARTASRGSGPKVGFVFLVSDREHPEHRYVMKVSTELENWPIESLIPFQNACFDEMVSETSVLRALHKAGFGRFYPSIEYHGRVEVDSAFAIVSGLRTASGEPQVDRHRIDRKSLKIAVLTKELGVSVMRIPTPEVPIDVSLLETIWRASILALSHLHQAGFIHGNMKPHHILMTANGIQLIDLGGVVPNNNVPILLSPHRILPFHANVMSPSSNIRYSSPNIVRSYSSRSWMPVPRDDLISLFLNCLSIISHGQLDTIGILSQEEMRNVIFSSSLVHIRYHEWLRTKLDWLAI